MSLIGNEEGVARKILEPREPLDPIVAVEKFIEPSVSLLINHCRIKSVDNKVVLEFTGNDLRPPYGLPTDMERAEYGFLKTLRLMAKHGITIEENEIETPLSRIKGAKDKKFTIAIDRDEIEKKIYPLVSARRLNESARVSP